MPAYPVLDNLRRGKPYAPGSEIELDAADAALLIALGVLGPALPASTTKPQGGGKPDPAQAGDDDKESGAPAGPQDGSAGQLDTHEAEGQPEGTGEADAGADASAPDAGAESAAPATDKPAQKRAKPKAD